MSVSSSPADRFPSDARPMPSGEPIAVVGMSCRLPGAGDVGEFWELLRDGREALGPVPEGRHDSTGRSGRGGYLPHVDGFDAPLFSISAREARDMDPQQRLLLELGWEALEDARIAPDAVRDTDMGVFVGVTAEDYALLRHRSGAAPGPHALTGANRSLLANRLAYQLGVHGPSMSVDTGQSSALAAVHLGGASIRTGESALALVGGVQLNLALDNADALDALGVLSPDGRCFVFDARANGTVRGEGGGVMVLKPLSQALADGDRIYCVIRGSALNHDGAGQGLTAPNPHGQEHVLRTACRQAGVHPAEVSYVELHGTGTPAGDLVEATALGTVYGPAHTGAPLWVGSAKTNVGHLEGAAGIVGLMKTALAVQHRVLPASLNFTDPHPEIQFDDLNLSVVEQTPSWPVSPRSGSAAPTVTSSWVPPPPTTPPAPATTPPRRSPRCGCCPGAPKPPCAPRPPDWPTTSRPTPTHRPVMWRSPWPRPAPR